MPFNHTCAHCQRAFTHPKRTTKYCSHACGCQSRRANWEDVWRSIDVRDPDACWNWQASKSIGYGIFTRHHKTYTAHRVVWFLTHNAWPAHQINHLCDNRSCCNPAHLYDGTQADNIHDRTLRHPKPCGKLSRFDIPIIRARIAAGEIARTIAADYGVGHTTIRNIKNGRTWRLVD